MCVHYCNLTLFPSQFLSHFRHCALVAHFEINSTIFTLKHGHFPHYLQHNIGQAPLPFVASRGTTCANENDKETHVVAPSNALHKRQFAMRVFCNAGEGEERDGCTVLTCKGSPKGRRTAMKKGVEQKGNCEVSEEHLGICKSC